MMYQDAYLEALYRKLDAGGTLEDIDAIVAEINTPSQGGLARWLEATKSVPCGTCSDAVFPDKPTPLLTTEILCPTCTKPAASS